MQRPLTGARALSCLCAAFRAFRFARRCSGWLSRRMRLLGRACLGGHWPPVQKKRALFLTNRDRLGRSTGLSGAFALPATVPSSFRASTRWCGGRRSPGSSTALGDTARKRRRFRRPQRLPQAPGQRQRLSAQRRFDNLRRLVSASCRSLVSALRRKRAPSAALPLPTKSPILRGPLMPSFPHGSPRNIPGVLRG